MTFDARPMSSWIFANFSLKSAVIHQNVCPNEPGIRCRRRANRNDRFRPTADSCTAANDARVSPRMSGRSQAPPATPYPRRGFIWDHRLQLFKQFLLLLRFAICSSLTPVRRCQILSAAILKSMGPRTTMKRGIAVLLSLSVLVTSAYLTASKWAIRHETISFYDLDRNNRLVAVDIAVRRDKEMQANAGWITLPVAILNHGNTVKHTEYSFLSNVFAFRGYLVLAPQHDLPTDPLMVTKVGELYAGRLPQIQRGVANIHFAIDEMKKIQPNADYEKVTMVGHSMGGDITMYFAKQYPDEIKKVVTLDNLRVPFLTDGKFKILSFRSKDPQFKADPGVVPDPALCEKAGITVVQTGFQHNDMRDTGPDTAKRSIQTVLDKFLVDTDSDVGPVDTRNAPLQSLDPAGPVTPHPPNAPIQN